MKEEKKRGIFTVDLKDLKDPWMALCAERGLVPGDVLKRCVEEMLAQPIGPQSSPQISERRTVALNPHLNESRRERVELRLLGSEYERAAQCMVADGYPTIPQWIVALVRAYLTGTAQFGLQDRELLGESNRQLLALGRNLNHIAKAVKEQGLSGGEFTVERIDQLSNWVDRHTEVVSKLIAANVERWSISHG